MGKFAPSEKAVGPAEEFLERPLLELYDAYGPALNEQCTAWLRAWRQGLAPVTIPEAAAHEAQRCLRAALDVCPKILDRALYEQLVTLGRHAGVDHIPPLEKPAPPEKLNAVQCAFELLEPLYERTINGHTLLWPAVIDPASNAERVQVKIGTTREGDTTIEIEVDQARVRMSIDEEQETLEHEGNPKRIFEIGRQVAEKARERVSREHLGWKEQMDRYMPRNAHCENEPC